MNFVARQAQESELAEIGRTNSEGQTENEQQTEELCREFPLDLVLNCKS